ncbi:MAG TPA: carboxypeptidase regulatory-like domain-containing protein [Burkholderiales bacterium]|jgi:virginiamycin B lyase|nr:carboxypeptidase regulatory-like domain-containing protein [Burkholderiales bacterium]
MRILILSLLCFSIPAWANLGGRVTSDDEGPMEGVLVSAKKEGSTITVTVVSNHDGSYHFPDGKLTPGKYALKVRAVGYELDSPLTVSVTKKGTVAHLKLKKTSDLAAQLSNGEWITSMPGTDQQKGQLLNCVGCHTVQRIARSHYDADTFTKAILPRMQGYVNQSIPQHPQLRRAERLMEERGDQRVQVYRSTAEYLSTVNLGEGSKWSYELKTFPRPTGRATKVVYTEYDLPRETISPHDVIVDKQGIAWYSSFGEQNLGRLDPKTGKVREFPVPVVKPGFPTGLLGLRADRDGNLWLGNMYQAQIAKFDRKTQKFTYWQLPKEQNIDAAQVNMVSPQYAHVDGKVWTQNNGFAGVHRLDIKTGQIETWEPYKNSPKGEPHNIYDVVPDSNNNAWYTDFRWRHIGRIDARTGEIKIFEIPGTEKPVVAPRRGQMDARDRLWFAQYRGDKITMLDTKSGEFKQWDVGPKWSAPYDVAIDKNEEAWTGSMVTDQVSRVNTRTGETVNYLLPRNTNIRRVFVDNSTTPVTFWVGSNHGASIIKLETFD